jgi:hypothetical protein
MKRKLRVTALIAIAIGLGAASGAALADYEIYKPVGDGWYEVWHCNGVGCYDTGMRLDKIPEV